MQHVYKPNQRQVRVDVLAAAGWVTGTLHVPSKSSLVAYMNKKAEFLPLTQVPLDPDAPPLGFLALRRQAILLVMPSMDDSEGHGGSQVGNYVQARLRCLFKEATVMGTAQILGGLRVSDFLETNPGFITLVDCSRVADGGRSEEGIPYLIVNASHMLAVADLTPARAVKEAVGDLVGASTLT